MSEENKQKSNIPPTEEDKEKKTNPVILSIKFRKTLQPLITNNDIVFCWDKNHYTEYKDNKLHKLIFKFFEDNKIISFWRKAKSNEMIEALKVNSEIPEVEELDPYDNLINLNNTVINLDTLKPEKQTPVRYFSYAIDVNHDPSLTEKDHPVFTKFLNDIFRIKEQEDPATVELIYYVMAYLIYPQIKMEKLFLFIGGGSNGKSILIEIIKAFFPDKYVTSLSLNVMSNDESFNRNPLFYSKLNISTEAKVGKKVDSEEIKKISSGENISLRRLHKEGVSVKSKTKVVLAGNDFVYVNDTTTGMDRRFCMFSFPNQFLPPNKYKKYKNPEKYNIYPAQNKDELIKAIKEERHAIFNTLLIYLDKLKKIDWKLPETENTERTMNEYKEGSDTLGSWLNEYYEVNENEFHAHPSSLDILNDFREYYEENFPGRRFKYSIQAVGKKIKQIFNLDSSRKERDIKITRTGITKTQRVRVYAVKRKTEKQDTINLPQEPSTPPPTQQDELPLEKIDFT